VIGMMCEHHSLRFVALGAGGEKRMASESTRRFERKAMLAGESFDVFCLDFAGKASFFRDALHEFRILPRLLTPELVI
ncbi:MAG: hypothetical protein AAGJ31_07640, partial [Verrucomicrobiota bacterium]